MSSNIVKQLDPIFKPKSVAVIGASEVPFKWGGIVINAMLNSEFRGRIYPINQKAAHIKGVKAYQSILDVPGEVELAVFAVPSVHMPGIMADCVKKGIKGGIIISADFAETGVKGKAIQDETVRIARSGGLRFVGPNGNGVISSAVNLNASPFPAPTPGPVAFVSQSGSFGRFSTNTAIEKRFGLSKFIAMGNQADLHAADYLEYLEQDEDTRVIALYVEGIKDGRRFFNVARKVSKQKPIIMMKGGSTEHGARATLSHTASIAGSDEIIDAMCHQAGIIRVYELTHLFVMAEALATQPLPKGNRIAVIANGGQGVAITDYLSSQGLEVPEFNPSDVQKIKEVLPPHAPTPRNPVDYAAGAVDVSNQVRVVDILASLDYIDGIITNVPPDTSIVGGTLAERTKNAIDAMAAFGEIPEKYGKPIITQIWSNLGMFTEFLDIAGIPVYDIAEDSGRAMTALVKYGEIKRRK